MNTDTYHYYLDKAHREDIQRTVHKQHLRRLARDHRFQPLSTYLVAVFALFRSILP